MKIVNEIEAINFVESYHFLSCITLHTPTVPRESKILQTEYRYRLRHELYEEYARSLVFAHEAHTILCGQFILAQYNDANRLADLSVLAKKIITHINDCMENLKTQLNYILDIELPLAHKQDKKGYRFFDNVTFD